MKDFFDSIWNMPAGDFGFLALKIVVAIVLLYITWCVIAYALFRRSVAKMDRHRAEMLDDFNRF